MYSYLCSMIDCIINSLIEILHEYCYKYIKNIKNIKNNDDVSSFYEKKNNYISIIEVETNNVIDYENLINYLNHHILLDNSVFYKQNFVRPIFVKFKYMGEIYKICLKKLESKNNQHKSIDKNPKILSAVLLKDENEIDITDTLKEFHGNDKNYFSHISDAISDLSYLLDSDGELHVYDMIGNINKYNIKKKYHKEE